jgi:hypothetical protein
LEKRDFLASDWLVGRSKKLLPEIPEVDKPIISVFPKFSPRLQKEHFEDSQGMFSPRKHLNQDWLSDNLANKEVKNYNHVLRELIVDAKNRIRILASFPNRIKQFILEDYLSFCEQENQHPIAETTSDFWNKIKDQRLDVFFDVYCKKIAIFYLLKIRFIRALNLLDDIQVRPEELISPNSFLVKVFQKNSFSEFRSTFIQANQYSWYAPDLSLINSLWEYFETSFELNYQDVIASMDFYKKGSLELSHKNMGLFVNSLLVNFHRWVFNLGKPVSSNRVEIVRTKFEGDCNIEHSSAHWLAQHNNSYFKWDEVVCPVFESSIHGKDHFFQLINEAEYYTFLTKISSFYLPRAVRFLAECANSVSRRGIEQTEFQKTFFSEDGALASNTFDRIVLSVLAKPKTNAHHNLLQKISEQIDVLSDQSQLVVLSSSNFFVPSQKRKIVGVLKKVKLEAVFDLSDIKCKGEIPDFIYIFSNRKDYVMSKRENCLHFKVRGELDSAQSFYHITDELNQFFDRFREQTPSFFQNDFHEDLQVEFFHSAIIDGNLFHTSNDKNHITHPLFFKSLIKNSASFSEFYDVLNLDIEGVLKGIDQRSPLQLDFSGNIDEGHLNLIVSFLSDGNVKVEIVSSEVLKAKAYEYGVSSSFYFKIIPKIRDLNHNLFREYFKSGLGEQVAQLSLNGSYHQVKGQINNFLVPKGFLYPQKIPDHIAKSFGFLLEDESSLFSENLNVTFKKLEEVSSFLHLQAQEHIYDVLSYLTQFKERMVNLLNSEGHSNKMEFDFNQTEIKIALQKLQTSSVYPNNNDLFIEFHSDRKELSRKMTRVELERSGKDITLNLFNDDFKILGIHCSQSTASFLLFFLPKIYGHKAIDILKNLKIPMQKDLDNLISKFFQRSDTIEKIIETTKSLIDKIYFRSIMKGMN